MKPQPHVEPEPLGAKFEAALEELEAKGDPESLRIEDTLRTDVEYHAKRCSALFLAAVPEKASSLTGTIAMTAMLVRCTMLSVRDLNFGLTNYLKSDRVKGDDTKRVLDAIDQVRRMQISASAIDQQLIAMSSKLAEVRTQNATPMICAGILGRAERAIHADPRIQKMQQDLTVQQDTREAEACL